MFHLRIFTTNLIVLLIFKVERHSNQELDSWEIKVGRKECPIILQYGLHLIHTSIIDQLLGNFQTISTILKYQRCFVKMDSSSTSKSTTRLHLSQIFETFIYINFEIKSDIAAIYMAAFTPINDNYLTAMCERRRIKMRICDLHVSSEREIEFWQRSGFTDGS